MAEKGCGALLLEHKQDNCLNSSPEAPVDINESSQEAPSPPGKDLSTRENSYLCRAPDMSKGLMNINSRFDNFYYLFTAGVLRICNTQIWSYQELCVCNIDEAFILSSISDLKVIKNGTKRNRTSPSYYFLQRLFCGAIRIEHSCSPSSSKSREGKKKTQSPVFGLSFVQTGNEVELKSNARYESLPLRHSSASQG